MTPLEKVYPLCLSKGWVKDWDDYITQWNEIQTRLKQPTT